MSETNGSTLPAVITSPYAIMNVPKDEFLEVIYENIGTDGLTASDLDRVRVPTAGGTTWSVPDLGGERSEKVLRGIIAYQTKSRAYWETAFEDAGGAPPTCYSQDGDTGVGNPGGTCATCRFNQWNTDRRGGKGKACRELRLLFMLQEGDLLPFVVVLPPTSVKIAQEYFRRLATKQLPYFSVVTEITLTREKNSGGISFARAAFRMAEQLPEEQADIMRSYKAAITPTLMTMQGL